jgi:hypothetical protein
MDTYERAALESGGPAYAFPSSIPSITARPTTVVVPDGQRCLICYGRARNGAIVHNPTCPDWRAPGRTTTGTARERRQAALDARGRYELFLSKLGPAFRRDRWECPRCGDTRHGGLRVDPGPDGSVLFWCFECCQRVRDDRVQLRGVRDEILEAVGLAWSDVLASAPKRTSHIPEWCWPEGAVAR